VILAAAALAVAVLAVARLADPFGGERPAPARPASRPPAPQVGPVAQPGEGLAVGLTETNAALIYHPHVGPAPQGFAPGRDQIAALQPRYFRIMVDWAVLQPAPTAPADLMRAVDGCSRGQPPCAPGSGVRELLRAVASQQRAGLGLDVLVTFYGVPDWAAAPPSGCERLDTAPRSRPIADAALPAYRALVRAVADLAVAEGVSVRWWAPWNEPNGPYFVSPQRAACDRAAPLVSPVLYTKLAREMRAELDLIPGDQQLAIAELAGLPGPRMRGGGVEEFMDALPDDVVCAAGVFTQHAYAERGDPDAATGPVEQLEAALDRRPCAADRPIWVTETGIGGPQVGGPRTGGEEELKADCRAMDAVLRRWDVDPRVQAAFQYTFRDDPSFPVGLADAALTRLWPAYELWRAWGGDRPPAGPAPELPDACLPAAAPAG
jgi:hypothetical protein